MSEPLKNKEAKWEEIEEHFEVCREISMDEEHKLFWDIDVKSAVEWLKVELKKEVYTEWFNIIEKKIDEAFEDLK